MMSYKLNINNGIRQVKYKVVKAAPMANFFKVSSNKNLSKALITAKVTRLDSNGCGVARYNNKPLFVQGSLPNEIVEVKLFEQKNKYARAKLINIQQKSIDRVPAKCQHFGICGGCDIQMLAFEQQLPFKQQKVTDLFSRFLISEDNENIVLPWQAAIESTPWHYRRKARLGVQFNKKAQAVIGFRQRSTNNLVAIKSCPVLVKPLNDIFSILKELLAQLTVKAAIGHIEVIYADIAKDNDKVTLVVRQLKSLNNHDVGLWREYASKHHWQVIIDEGKKQSCITNKELTDSSSILVNDKLENEIYSHSLSYNLTVPQQTEVAGAKQVVINFSSSDFIQINHSVNLAMIEQALAWLAIKSTDNVLDLFCGLGNFSLAIATSAAQVTGVEGVQVMADKANLNAKQNNITNCHFYQADLNDDWLAQCWAKQTYDKVLLDPARAGAEQAVKQVAYLKIPTVLYVSCDPETLARDSQLLISQGYQLDKISLIDMFSQTKHVETMVLFTLKSG